MLNNVMQAMLLDLSSSSGWSNERVVKFKSLKSGTTCERNLKNYIFHLLKLSLSLSTRACGSTVGPMLSKLGLRTIDVGGPMLSMHSIRETAGADDVQHAIDLFSSLFEGFSEIDQKLTVD